MKIHRLHCQDPWFSLIRSGKKLIEGRKDLPTFKDWQPGDTIIFYLGNRSFKRKIAALRRYKSLEGYLQSETLERTLPGVSSIAEGVDIYLQWSTKEEIERMGFLAIEVSLE